MPKQKTIPKNSSRKRLLIVTQKVDMNDPILGFFHRWIVEFAANFERVTVICLQKGEYQLPQHVRVFSLGKETKKSRFRYLINFYSFIFKERDSYDTVFVHMNPIYVILGAPVWKSFGKKIALWYVHKHVDLKLRIAEKFAGLIFTASKESFRLPSQKLRVAGHGIDIGQFAASSVGVQNNTEPNTYRLLSVGRISKTKQVRIMVEAVQKLLEQHCSFALTLVGSGVTTEDKQYENKIKHFVKEAGLDGSVQFAGNISPSAVNTYYRSAQMLINLSETGSMDKAVLEGMLSGLQILTSNEAFKNIVPAQNFISPADVGIEILTKKIQELSQTTVDPDLKKYVMENHNIKNLIPKIASILSEE